MLNQLYDKLRLYSDFFQPVMRLEQTLVLPQDSARRRIRRRYDQARTPLQRLCATGVLPADARHHLEVPCQVTNPRKLRKEIYELLGILHRLPGAVEGQPHDVYQPLLTPTVHQEEEAETR